MVSEQTVESALEYIRSTPPLNRCGIQDVIDGGDCVDVRLGLPTPDHMGVHDLFVMCKQTAKEHNPDDFRLEPNDNHHIDEYDDPYFYLSVYPAE